MSNRQLILDTIKTELTDKVHVSNGYNTHIAEAKHGIYMFEDALIKPCVYYWCHRDSTDQAFANVDRRRLHIYMYGYTNATPNNVDAIYDLVDDVEYFLYNDFTYADDVNIGDMTVFISDNHAMFDLEIEILYDVTTNTR